jgi:DNA-binding MarR family transcriptional regulator
MKIDILDNIQFFMPTEKIKKLLLLEQIEKNKNITQIQLAKYIHSAPSMINNYIKTLEKDGLLIKNKKSKRDVEYSITKKGVERKNYLLVTFMNELIELYNLTKENIESFIKNLEDKGIKRVVFYGAGETAKVIIKVLKDMPESELELLFLVDDDDKKKGITFERYKVIDPEKLKEYEDKIDAVIITSCVYENEILDRLKRLNIREGKIAHFLRYLQT